MLLVVSIALLLGSTVAEPSFLDNLKKRLYQNKDNGDISEKCKSQYDKALNDPLVALQMFDSSTKIPEGVLRGRLSHFGDFDECIDIKSGEGSEAVFGKYCLGSYESSAPEEFRGLFPEHNYSHIMVNPQPRAGLDPVLTLFSMALCIPSGCSPEEALQIVGINSLTFAPTSCYSKDTAPELTWGPIFTIAFLGVFIGIALISSLYDIYLYYTKTTSHPILTAFSVVSNTKKLVKASSNQDQLLCLNGIKAISMMWVVLGHQYDTAFYFGPLGDYIDMYDWISSVANMPLMGATVSVDTFFVVGGLVTVYTFLRAHKRGVKLNVPMLYIHRYLRLTPVLAVVVLFHATLPKYLSDGPLWNTFHSALSPACRERWWTALLYIQNYVHNEEMDSCVPQSWYLSVDMQLFILSPLVLLPLARWPKYTLWGLYVLTGLGIIIPFVLGQVYELYGTNVVISADVDKGKTIDFNRLIYKQTFSRFAPYVMGMILGYYVYKIKNKEASLKLNGLKVVVLWSLSIGGLLACVYAGHDLVMSGTDIWSNSLYLAFNRPAWSFCVCLVILACVSGYGGPIDKFLSLSFFQFLTKISYSMYLVHYIIIAAIHASRRYPINFTNFNMVYMFLSSFVFVVPFSMAMCLLFESPIVVIEKLLFGNLGKASANGHEKKSKTAVNSGV